MKTQLTKKYFYFEILIMILIKWLLKTMIEVSIEIWSMNISGFPNNKVSINKYFIQIEDNLILKTSDEKCLQRSAEKLNICKVLFIF